MSLMTKKYGELVRLKSFDERVNYLKTNSQVGLPTFGWERYLNQKLYCSPEWKRLRNEIIIRDNGCDLALEGYNIYSHIIIHHIEPISIEDIRNRDPKIMDPDNLVCVSHNTHNLIHYGNNSLYPHVITERKKNDTCPWK